MEDNNLDRITKTKQMLNALRNTKNRTLETISNVVEGTSEEREPEKVQPKKPKVEITSSSDGEKSDSESEDAPDPEPKRKTSLGMLDSDSDSDSDSDGNERFEEAKGKFKHFTNRAAYGQLAANSDSESEDEQVKEEEGELCEEVEKLFRGDDDDDEDGEDSEDDLSLPQPLVRLEKSKARLAREKKASSVNKPGRAQPAKFVVKESAASPDFIVSEMRSMIKDGQLSEIVVHKHYYNMSPDYSSEVFGRKLTVAVSDIVRAGSVCERVRKDFERNKFWKTARRGILMSLDGVDDLENSDDVLNATKDSREEGALLRDLCAETLPLLMEAIRKRNPLLYKIVKLAEDHDGFTVRNPAIYHADKHGENVRCVVSGFPLSDGNHRMSQIEVILKERKSKSDVLHFALFAGKESNDNETLTLRAKEVHTLVYAILFLKNPVSIFEQWAQDFMRSAKFKKATLDNPAAVFLNSIQGGITIMRAVVSIISMFDMAWKVING